MVSFYYPKIYHIHCIIRSLHLWGTNVLCFQHLWFDIGNICAGPVYNIWKAFLSFYDMQSDLCFGTSVWFSPVALPAGCVLLIGISLEDWKKPGFLTSPGHKDMLCRNLPWVENQREKMLSHGVSWFTPGFLVPREQVKRKERPGIIQPELSWMFSLD